MTWAPRSNVLVPFDFSADSLTALETALELAVGPEAVHVIHVLPDLSPMEPGVIWETVSDKDRARHAEEQLRQKIAGAKFQGVTPHIVFGDAGSAIADFAEKQKVDLIVMPSHGRTGLSRLLIGSVADRVMRLSHCPVLVLRK